MRWVTLQAFISFLGAWFGAASLAAPVPLEFSPEDAQSPTTVIIGVPSSLDPFFFVHTFAPTMEHLRRTMPGVRFRAEEYSLAQLREAVRANTVHFFVVPSGDYAYLAASSGAQHLATRRIPLGHNPAQSVGSVFLVRSDAHYRTLADLKGARVVATSSSSLEGWIAALGEISRIDPKPETFFRETLFTNFAYPDPIMFLRAREGDVAVLKSCEIERLLAEGVSMEGLRVLGARPQQGDSLRCLHSTELYPDLVFASLSTADPVLTERVALALLTMQSGSDGTRWGLSNSFESVTNLYRTLKIGPYEHLRYSTWDYVWTTYREWFLGVLALLLLLGAHVVRTDRLVRVRTAELSQTLDEKARLEAESTEARRQLGQWERMSIVASLSSMLAHELRQPITSLINFSAGLRMYMKSIGQTDATMDEVATRIETQTRRIAAIVERVREYARNSEASRASFSITETVRRAIDAFRLSKAAQGVQIEACIPDEKVRVDGFELEIELLIVNLLKNAAEAARESERPVVWVELACREDRIVLTVKDNGPRISQEAFDSLMKPTLSSKPDGLGLGLYLCRTIAEHHGARLSFERSEPSGLVACFAMDTQTAESLPAISESTYSTEEAAHAASLGSRC